MKVTIEEINGKRYTVIHHEEDIPHDIKKYNYKELDDRTLVFLTTELQGVSSGRVIPSIHLATALPALPRNPKQEDVGLLLEYAAKGLYPQLYICRNGKKLAKFKYCIGDPLDAFGRKGIDYLEIDCCIDEQSKKIEVMIDGK